MLRVCREDHNLHGAVLARGYDHATRFWVVAHGFCPRFCADFLDRGILVGGILMKDEDLAIAGRKVDEFGRGIPGSGIDAIANGSREDDLAAVRIEDGEMMAAATDEEPAVLFIE